MKNTEQILEEFDRSFGIETFHDDVGMVLTDEQKQIRYFIKEAIEQTKKEEIGKIEMLIAKEINIARSEGEKTSRLTSLFNLLKTN